MGSETQVDQDWLSPCFFTLGWAHSQLSLSLSRALGPPAPSSELKDAGLAWPGAGISGPLAVTLALKPGLAAWLTDFLGNHFIYTKQEESNSIN